MSLLQLPVNNNDQKQGKDDAPITLLEYGDYECPSCGAAYPVIKELQQHFGDKLLFVFRNFPLTQFHMHALPAAWVAEAAALQQKFWPVHDLLFENQDDLSASRLLDYAHQGCVDIQVLVRDMRSEQILNKVEQDVDSGTRSGVHGTPTFFINGKQHEGAYDFGNLKHALSQLL